MANESNETQKRQEMQLIVFQLGDEEYTLPIESVQEIIMPVPTIHMPNTPAYIEGIINLRGRVIMVIDGRKKFNFEVKETTAETRIIVLDFEEHTVGLIVDAVSEVIHLNSDCIEAPPIDVGEEHDFIQGIGKYQNKLLILLNPKEFIQSKEIEINPNLQAQLKALS